MSSLVTDVFLFTHDIVFSLYDGALDIKNSVDERIVKAVKNVILVVAMKSNLNLAAISVIAGIVCHKFCIEATNLIWAAIFNPKIENKIDDQDDRVQIAWQNINALFTRAIPVVFVGCLGFMTLPTVAYPASAIFAGLRLGAYFGSRASRD